MLGGSGTMKMVPMKHYLKSLNHLLHLMSNCNVRQDENIKVYDNLKSLYSSITMRIRGLDGKDPFELKQGLKG